MIIYEPTSESPLYKVQLQKDMSTGFHEVGVMLGATSMNHIDVEVLGIDEDFADSVAELGRCLAQSHDIDESAPARISRDELGMLGLSLACFIRRTPDLLGGLFALTGPNCSGRRLESVMAEHMLGKIIEHVNVDPINHISIRRAYQSWIPAK